MQSTDSRHPHGVAVRSTKPWPSGSGWLIAGATLLALGVKLYVSSTFFGTLDIVYWQQFLATIRREGDTRIYEGIFNHPPFMMHVLRVIGSVADHTGLPFPFCFRLPAILADAGAVWLVWKIIGRARPGAGQVVAVLGMALAPVSVAISGYHGNTDAVMACFVVLAVLLRDTSAAWAAGIAFGMAMNIKIVPVIFAPAFLLYRYELRKSIVFAGAAAATLALASMPYLLEDPWIIAQRVFGYQGPWGTWGIPMLLRLGAEHLQFQAVYSETWSEVPGLIELYTLTVAAGHAYAQWTKYLLLGGLALLALWMNRAARRPPLFLQCAVTAFLFVFFAPGFGMQYLAWLVPWAVAAGPLAALLFYAASGAYSYWLYTSNLQGSSTLEQLAVVCWLSAGIVATVLCHRVRVTVTAPAPSRGWAVEIRFAVRIAAGAVVVLALVLALLHVKAGSLPPGRFERPFVIASTNYGPPFLPEGAVDGRSDVSAWESGGGWNSAGQPTEERPESLTFFMTARHRLRGITLYSYPDPRFTLKSFVFQYRADGRWQDIEATRVRDNTEATRWSFEFPTVTTRQLQLLILGSADQYARVLEVEFTDEAAPAP
jgi:hypothetical protein